MSQLTISTCPICGSRKIRRLKRDIKSNRGGVSFVARNIEIDECPNCQEQLFSPEALEKIDAQRAQSKKRGTRRRSA